MIEQNDDDDNKTTLTASINNNNNNNNNNTITTIGINNRIQEQTTTLNVDRMDTIVMRMMMIMTSSD